MKPEQITAWALDEASAEECQQLEAALLENPEDKQKADETKAFCDFLLKELRDESLAFTEEQRERLVGQASRLPSSPAASETLALQSEAQSILLRTAPPPPHHALEYWCDRASGCGCVCGAGRCLDVAFRGSIAPGSAPAGGCGG